VILAVPKIFPWFMLAAVLTVISGNAVADPKPVHPFFAFCMDTHDSLKRTLPQQAELLKELGYDGAGHLWLDNLEERLKTLDAAGLKLFQVYLSVNIATKEAPYDTAKLDSALSLLKGRGVMIALLMAGMPPSDQNGDPRGVQLIQEIADKARPFDVRVALYPHSNDWLEKVDDALRLAKKANRPNVGVMFNLCHWIKVDKEENLKPLLTSAMPLLYAVSLHGADHATDIQAGKGNWIQPLDSGSFDIRSLLTILDELGYQGPIGLQCYGIQGDARDHLARSIAAWRKLNASAAPGNTPK